MGLTPQVFATLSVDDVHDLVEGARWREERQRDILAWHALHVMSAFGAKKAGDQPLELRDLLGRAPVSLVPPPPPSPDAPEPPDPVLTKLEALEGLGLIRRVEQ